MCFSFLLFLLALVAESQRDLSGCPCSNTSLCNHVEPNYSKELYTFIGGGANINDTSFYNWTYITSLAIKYEWVNDPGVDQIMCEAHKHNVRVIYRIPNNFPFTFNTDTIMKWVTNLYNLTVNTLYYDGITFDYEGHMLWNSNQSLQYNKIVDLTSQYFHQNLPGSTVSVCVPFQAYLVNGREYDYISLSNSTDFLYIMGYDTQPQIFDGPCIAKANSPYQSIQRGVVSYINLGINASKLVLGVPWYGRQYPCILDQIPYPNATYCPIIPKENNGVNCSQSAGAIISYAGINQMIYKNNWNVTAVRYDNVMLSPFVNVQKHNKATNLDQVWWDDVYSLTLKYKYAKSMNLRGVGPFQTGDLIQDGSEGEIDRAQKMWAAFDQFFI